MFRAVHALELDVVELCERPDSLAADAVEFGKLGRGEVRVKVIVLSRQKGCRQLKRCL